MHHRHIAARRTVDTRLDRIGRVDGVAGVVGFLGLFGARAPRLPADALPAGGR